LAELYARSTSHRQGGHYPVDDAWLPALWDRIGIGMGLEAFQRRCQVRVEALNHALRGIPEDRVRYHFCWGSWHGPHAYDLELKHLVDVLLSVKAQAYLIEGANARHEHEYDVWETVPLPEGKIYSRVSRIDGYRGTSGLVCSTLKIARGARKENVIAGADCGGGENASADRMGEAALAGGGAKLATAALW
jgi:5-methyltetrahydropteroyltriglutamate--homocysteine methyltransferase